MAQYRQSGYDSRFGGNYINGNGNTTDLHHNHVAIGIRSGGGGATTHHKQSRGRRFGGHKVGKKISIGTFVVVLCLILAVTALAYIYLSGDKVTVTDNFQDDDFKSDQDFLTNVSRINKVKFGHGSMSQGRDSRYWDGDDRRRDEDYSEDVVDKSRMVNRDEENEKDHAQIEGKNVTKKLARNNKEIHRPAVGLYNEAGRNELRMYEEKYQASLKNVGQSGDQSQTKNHGSDDGNMGTDNQEIDIDDEYDDGIDFHDSWMDDYEDASHNEANSDLPESHSQDGVKSDPDVDKRREMAEDAFRDSLQDTSVVSHNNNMDGNPKPKPKSSPIKKPRKKPKHRNTCELKFLNSTSQLVEPLESRKFARFNLQYTSMEEKPDGVESWKPRFAGHQSLREREESFIARDQQIHCGFVKGPRGYPSTGFDLAEDDAKYISRCHIAVVSCIFGNSDNLRSPTSKAVTRLSRKNVCFVMFMDEETLQTLTADGQIPDRMGFIGFWKIVIVKNLPYSDMRRVGKIPKLLSHRLFPSARYSIWLDSKLRLTRDPLLILEYFLWRKGHEYAISNHYDRHCMWEEVAQNKKLNKYNHTIIDQQFAFYQADGLKRFNASDPDKMLPSNVPEGSLIIRAHTAMSNLFSCLWFNEVDRFTPRDQLSFAYTYQKLRKKNSGRPFYLHMFKDCERRSVAKLYRHRTEEMRIAALETA